MAMLNYDVFEAFKSAGADDEKARKAAEALSGSAKTAELVEVRSDVVELKTTQKLHTWILGFNTAMLAALLLRVFSG
jgi:hypothetical protein